MKKKSFIREITVVCGNCCHVRSSTGRIDGEHLCVCPVPASLHSKRKRPVNIHDDGKQCPCFSPMMDGMSEQ